MAAILVIAAGVLFRITRVEWLSVLLCIGLVTATEIFNTVAERLCDFVSPERREKIKIIKDIAVAGVLFKAPLACVTGGRIFFLGYFHL